ncbi:Type II secretion system (T2SS) pilotin, S protein [Vibrio hangzhouensis]|uniref:Type II secretion system (T2SS) pilotin, S protein n=2 Tax=Vibrionaceae TaxID=641 RepID=A0A1H5Y1Z8_9VIBR|nr:Type II secretion system (T2SS) pilotin, S protein [Vibrio hangzhouensis]
MAVSGMMKKQLTWLALAATSILAGCANTGDDQQRQIEMLAQSRASVLSSGLPIEQGPLSIMKASANKGVVEIMMLYNTDAKGAKPIDTVLRNSMNYYCTDREVKANLDMGLAYRIMIRNARGQLMVDQMVTKQYCNQPVSQ